MKAIDFPIRLMPRGKRIVILLPKHYGSSSKIYLRTIAKGLKRYHCPINCNINGKSNDGKSIPIDTVGRWLFGTPGFKGHMIVRSMEEDNYIYIDYPKDAPKIITFLLEELKKEVEK